MDRRGFLLAIVAAAGGALLVPGTGPGLKKPEPIKAEPLAAKIDPHPWLHEQVFG